MDNRGFTLIELLVTIAIVAIMLMLAVPSYSHITTAKRMTSELDALLVDMQYARSEAQRQGAQITICASSDQGNCSNSNEWHHGWIVLCTAQCAGSTPILKVQQAFKGTEVFDADNNVSALTFGPTGFPYPKLATAITLTMSANNDATLTRCLQISIVGQLSTPGTCT